MSSEKKILPCEVAKLLGKSNLFIYEAMKRGYLNIGIAMQMPNSTKWTFSISPTLLAGYMGIDIPTLNERLANIRGEGSVEDCQSQISSTG